MILSGQWLLSPPQLEECEEGHGAYYASSRDVRMSYDEACDYLKSKGVPMLGIGCGFMTPEQKSFYEHFKSNLKIIKTSGPDELPCFSARIEKTSVLDWLGY